MANPTKPTAAMATAIGTPKAITTNRTTTLSPPNSPGLIGPPPPAPGFAADNHSPAPWVRSLRSTRPRRLGERPWPAPLLHRCCLLYTSDAADDLLCVDLGGRRIIKKKKKQKKKNQKKN